MDGEPVTSDLDIYRSAKLLINQHGEGAAVQAAMTADAMLDKRDLDAAALRRRRGAASRCSAAGTIYPGRLPFG